MVYIVCVKGYVKLLLALLIFIIFVGLALYDYDPKDPEDGLVFLAIIPILLWALVTENLGSIFVPKQHSKKKLVITVVGYIVVIALPMLFIFGLALDVITFLVSLVVASFFIYLPIAFKTRK